MQTYPPTMATASEASYSAYSAPSEMPPSFQRQRMGSLSLGPAPASENGGGSTANGGAGAGATTSAGASAGASTTAVATDLPRDVQDVLQSEIGVSTMLNRLKQSIATAKVSLLFAESPHIQTLTPRRLGVRCVS